MIDVEELLHVGIDTYVSLMMEHHGNIPDVAIQDLKSETMMLSEMSGVPFDSLWEKLKTEGDEILKGYE